ncbi:MAG: FAD-dependent oxidoreductase, partial [Leptospiraceae bacterium]|nr:FAD-dependent oxidoreductase [Leptospiraceae bacterium]
LHQSLSAAKARAQESILPTDGLTGAAVYYDCQSIFPERLTLAFIKSAEYHGARVANYAEVSDFIREGNQIRGVVVRDHLRGGSDVRVYGRLLINSGGPWAEHMLRRMAGENVESHLRTSEGIHIIVNRPLVKDHAVALITPEGRHFFLVPWRNHTLIGTTDREYTGKPDEYRVTRESVDEFLKEINDTLGADTVRHQDIVHTYGGLRPLTDTTAKSSYKSSRKYEILDSAELGMEGVLTVEGGKYTTSRNLAVNVLKLARKKLDAMGVQSHGARYNTARKPLFGCEIPSMSGFLEHVAEKYPDVGAETRDFIARNYGTDFQNILEIAKENPAWARPRNADGEILAEVVFSIRREMARTLEDILLRRTGFGTLGMPDDDLLKDIAQLAAGELGHD